MLCRSSEPTRRSAVGKVDRRRTQYTRMIVCWWSNVSNLPNKIAIELYFFVVYFYLTKKRAFGVKICVCVLISAWFCLGSKDHSMSDKIRWFNAMNIYRIDGVISKKLVRFHCDYSNNVKKHRNHVIF